MSDGNTSTTLSKVEFFKPGAITGGVGGWTDWELQSGASPTLTRQRAQSLNEDGDELNSVQHGAKIAYVETFAAKTVTTTQQKTHLDIPAVGAISGGAHVDSVSVAYSQTGAPSLTVNSHRHAAVNGTPSTHGNCRVYTPTVSLPIRAIGVPSTLSDTAQTPNVIFAAPAGVGMKSLTYSLSVTHTDEDDGDGNHLAGQNRDGVETLTIEFTGKVVTSELAIHASWMLADSDADGQGNTLATTKSITITKHIAYDATNTPTGAEN